jgi:hypothetical protein
MAAPLDRLKNSHFKGHKAMRMELWPKGKVVATFIQQ